MKNFAILGLLCLLFGQTNSFGKQTYTIWENDKIDTKIKQEINKDNKLVYKAMCDTDLKSLSHFFSDTLKKGIGPDFANKFLPQIQTVIKGKEYKVFDEFYVKNPTRDSAVTIKSGKGDGAYSFKFNTFDDEAYVAMLVAGDTVNQVMITLVYGKTKDGWKLYFIRGEDYALTNRTANDFFMIARNLGTSGDFIDAINVLSVGLHCANPGGVSFIYDNFNHMKEYSDTLNFKTKQKYPLPYTVEQLNTKPQVFNIHLEMYKGNLVPLITYQSTIYLKDTVALKAENEEFHSKLGTIFTGMDKYNKTLLYRAYNEKPNGQNNPDSYGFIKKED